MSRPFHLLTAACAGLFFATGCVSVDTPDTNVRVGVTSVKLPGSGTSDPYAMPYAKPLKKVTAQQGEVAKQLARRDWEELADESSDWITYTRELTGYAGTSHDSGLFLACCEELSHHVQALRQAALRHDAAAAQRAFDGCDAPLSRLVQSFPLTGAPAQYTAASPPATAPPPAQPSPKPARKPMVP